MGNNRPTAEWRSWKDMLENAKKAVMDELLVSNVAGISTPDLNTTSVPLVAPLGPTVSTVATSSTSSVTHLVLNA
ncbi:serine hydroxymethyltransferase 7-like [Pyrus ussuriensis x Pyrus communis]|uniref:Serine hydroxymethyltransferase 7-like n=1 Tax=Pyrus ussuriensis x Pyrus communis TaxID=2448454 RepID=A0A5N5HYI6_9ROSA|nr:serine hydroxymethyltransferase 7-like [Pyrus ussuriensis x Pyrus communis]